MQTDKKSTELVIDDERRLAWIQFPSGKKSQIWESKEEAIDGICMHFAGGEIAIENLKPFLKQIAVSKLPMPTGNDEELLIYILDDVPTIGIEELLFISNPTFTICDCGLPGKHGRIENDDGRELFHITTRSEGFRRTEQLRASELIDEAGAEKLRRKIQKADFPPTKEFSLFFS